MVYAAIADRLRDRRYSPFHLLPYRAGRRPAVLAFLFRLYAVSADPDPSDDRLLHASAGRGPRAGAVRSLQRYRPQQRVSLGESLLLARPAVGPGGADRRSQDGGQERASAKQRL